LLGDDGGPLDLLRAAQHVHLAEALALQVAQRAAQFAGVPADDPAGHVGAVGAGRVALGAHLLGHVEHDGYGQHVVPPGQFDELLAGLLLDAGGVPCQVLLFSLLAVPTYEPSRCVIESSRFRSSFGNLRLHYEQPETSPGGTSERVAYCRDRWPRSSTPEAR